MNKRIRLGLTNLQVSPICFGTWQLSPRFWGKQDEKEIKSAMKFAYENGINVFDTADAYGDGFAETVLGEFINEVKRENLIICTKVYNHFKPDKSRYPDLSPDHVKYRCETQLKRMRTDYIDIYLLHYFDQLTPIADVAYVMESLKKEGKIRFYGVSNHNVEQIRAQRAFGQYNVVQNSYSFLNKKDEDHLFPYCQSQDIGVMVYSPIHMGLLSGKYTRGDEQFDDFRKNHPDFQGNRFKMIIDALNSIKEIADHYNISIYQLILTATLMHPSIHTAVVGVKTKANIEEAIKVVGRSLSREDYFTIKNRLNIDDVGKVRDASGTRK